MTTSRREFLCSLTGSVAATATAGHALAWNSAAARSDTSGSAHPDDFILLYSNENAYGPSPKVLELIRSSGMNINRYPRLEYNALVERIAAANRVKVEQVLLGCGSTDILRMAAFSFLSNGKQLIHASPTFEAIEHYARAVGSDVFPVPLARDFSHDLQGMLAHANASTGLVYVCNPNNPTATLTPRSDLDLFISKLPSTAYVIIDEAYHHYAGQSAMYASFIDRPLDNDRVIVVRTFSKAYGLAGLRVGYGVASTKAIQEMRKFSTQDCINAIAAKVLAAALDDTAALNNSVRRNVDERQEFFNQAMARALKPIDSHANFVMMNTLHPAQEIIDRFRNEGILIGRRFPEMDTYIRVSLGRPEEMHAFWKVWDTLPYPKGSMHH
jgi:histidinol-phosphate aminotransferase